jgi:hypothetical protein
MSESIEAKMKSVYVEAMKISHLCTESLKTKWYKGSLRDIYDRCPFCEDADDDCDVCLCPKEICNNDPVRMDEVHIITEYLRLRKGKGKKNEMIVKNIPIKMLRHIQALFHTYIKNYDLLNKEGKENAETQ